MLVANEIQSIESHPWTRTMDKPYELKKWGRGSRVETWLRSVKVNQVTWSNSKVARHCSHLPWSLVCLLCGSIGSPRLWSRDCVWQKSGRARQKKGVTEFKKNVKILKGSRALKENYWNNILKLGKFVWKLNKYRSALFLKRVHNRTDQLIRLMGFCGELFMGEFCAEGAWNSDVKFVPLLRTNTPFVQKCDSIEVTWSLISNVKSKKFSTSWGRCQAMSKRAVIKTTGQVIVRLVS